MNIKKLFAILLCALLLITCLASCNNKKEENNDNNNNDKSEEDFVYGKFNYGVNGEGTYEITGFNYNEKEVIGITIPHQIEGRLVTGIAADAFKACQTLEKVAIPNTIEYIGEAAFYDCDKLTTVKIGGWELVDKGTKEVITTKDHEALVSIGANAFNSCDALTKIELPNSVVNIDDSAFINCKALEKATLSNSLTKLGMAAFYGCASLTDIVLPETLTDIGDCAFYGCTALTKASVLSTKLGVDVVEGEKVIEKHEIGKEVFSNCNDALVITVTKDSAFDSYAQVMGYKIAYPIVEETE